MHNHIIHTNTINTSLLILTKKKRFLKDLLLYLLLRSSLHCRNNPRMEKAKPEDLVIVCGEVSVETENQYSSPENEVYKK